MSLIEDIARAYHDPRGVMRAHVARGITEPQTLFYGMFFGLMNVVANYPRILGNAADQNNLTQDMSVIFVGNIFVMPLVLYGIATALHWVILKFGGHGTWAEARRALNWSAVATVPLILLSGVSYVFNNNLLSGSLNTITAVVFIWFIWFNFKQIEFH